MKAKYISIHKVLGATALPQDTEAACILRNDLPMLTATLVRNPEPYFVHIDRSVTLREQFLRGLFGSGNGAGPNEALATGIADIKSRRAKETAPGVFLVFEGEIEAPTLTPGARRDTEDFTVCFDAVAKPEIRQVFDGSLKSTIAALSLSLLGASSRSVQKLGEEVYLVDTLTQKPTYSFTVTGFAPTVSISGPMTTVVISEAAALALQLLADRKLARPVSLLLTSLEKETDELQSFIAAWSALEIFVNAMFKSTYEARWFKIMEDGAPESSEPFFERLKDVMNDKYRLADKFVVIASVLDSAGAKVDYLEFSKIKKVRDGLLHALDSPLSALPIGIVQNLLLKYVKLHLAHGA